jgi:hypothetical protein
MIRSIAPALGAGCALMLFACAARADVATLFPAKDNTLFQPVGTEVSSGSGPDLYVGRTAFNGSRRAVMSFDLAPIPSSATINSVTLNFRVTRTPQGGHQEDVTLRRLTADWGEGASAADGGDGDPAQPGDATWMHRFYPDTSWASEGGDFVAAISATRHLAGNGTYSFTSATMAADVQGWLSNPSSNFGWIMIGDEGVTQTARRLASRENPDITLRPQLVVTYTVPEPAGIGIGSLLPVVLCRRPRSRMAR